MPLRPACLLRRQLLASATLVALLSSLPSVSRAAELLVSAAASLSNAFKDLAPAFEAAHPGLVLRLNFAASDALLAQISHGAPVDVFASADQETMDRAEAQKLLAPGSRRSFVSNTLVLVVPAGAGLVVTGLADLARPELRRIVLGKPEGVPAGRYARGALEAARLWPAVEAKAVYANNVRQALDYVARGEVDAGFVYASDAAAQKGKVVVVSAVPTVQRVSYPVAALKDGPNADLGAQFIDYLLSPAAQALLARHGFGRP